MRRWSHLTTERLDHHLGVHDQMVRVHRVDVLTSLGLNFMDECIELVDHYRGLTAVLCRLGRVEFGKQTVGDTLIVDEALLCSMLDACSQRRDGWRMDAIIARLGASRSRSEQTDPNQRQKQNQSQNHKA